MGKTYETIDERLREWINRQKMFFVSTAPLSGEGLINCSPKGLETFRILDEREVAYLDLTGSGIETVAHLKENGRIVIMFCSFDRNPLIVRLHGRGLVHPKGSTEFDDLVTRFDPLPGTRAIIHMQVQRISDSCGYGVPMYEYAGQRTALTEWAAKKGEDGVAEYQMKHNANNIEGLPGMQLAFNEEKQ